MSKWLCELAEAFRFRLTPLELDALAVAAEEANPDPEPSAKLLQRFASAKAGAGATTSPGSERVFDIGVFSARDASSANSSSTDRAGVFGRCFRVELDVGDTRVDCVGDLDPLACPCTGRDLAVPLFLYLSGRSSSTSLPCQTRPFIIGGSECEYAPVG